MVDIAKITCPYFAMTMAIQRLFLLMNLTKKTSSSQTYCGILSFIWIFSVFMAVPNLMSINYEEFYEYENLSSGNVTSESKFQYQSIEFSDSKFHAILNYYRGNFDKISTASARLKSAPPDFVRIDQSDFKLVNTWAICSKQIKSSFGYFHISIAHYRVIWCSHI